MDSPERQGMSVEAAEEMILQWGSEEMIFEGDRTEVERYLEAVDEIQRSMSSASVSDKVNPAIQTAMARLEVEFRNILNSHTSPAKVEELELELDLEADVDVDADAAEEVDEEGSSSRGISRRSSYRSTSSIRELDLIPSEAIYDLRSIAQRMISASYLPECVHVYGSVRRWALDATLNSLGIHGDVQALPWDLLQKKIRRWTRAARLCVRVLFPSEKKLCEHIFYGLGTAIDDACFMDTVNAPATHLFSFAHAISLSSRSPEKLFKILDLHDALMDLTPDIDLVFHCKSSDPLRAQAAQVLSQLAEAARGILSEFENAVLREPSKILVPGGTIHPLTRYVMNYISLISDYKQVLIELIVSKPSTGTRYSGDPTTPDMEFAEFEGHTPLALHLIWIIVILQFNLDGKSRHDRDASLSHLFMMNNVHYIVQKIKGSPELREMIGDDYLRRLTGKFRTAATSYQRATWVRVLYCLRDEGLHVSGSFSSGVSKSALRERFKNFNAMFEEVHKTQATWFVPDTQLREELRISISEKLLPAYRSFLGRFRSHIESGRHPENYIKYSVDDLETAVLDFFEGCTISQHLRRRSM